MVATSQPATHAAGFDKPKGVNALLVKLLCPPTDALNLSALAGMTGSLVVALARLVLLLSFALIPAWLWQLRRLILSEERIPAGLLFGAGLVLLLICDFLASLDAAAKAERKMDVIVAGSGVPYQKLPRSAGGALSAARANSAAPAPAPNAVPVATSRVAHLANANDPAVHAVKQLIIRLEAALFGNELTEGDIARDQLHVRVGNLCREVGIEFPENEEARALPLSHLQQMLGQVETAVGISTR